MDIYCNKYLKYKSKYLKLKNQYGGGYERIIIDDTDRSIKLDNIIKSLVLHTKISSSNF
jgi:hypothetical protein